MNQLINEVFPKGLYEKGQNYIGLFSKVSLPITAAAKLTMNFFRENGAFDPQTIKGNISTAGQVSNKTVRVHAMQVFATVKNGTDPVGILDDLGQDLQDFLTGAQVIFKRDQDVFINDVLSSYLSIQQISQVALLNGAAPAGAIATPMISGLAGPVVELPVKPIMIPGQTFDFSITGYWPTAYATGSISLTVKLLTMSVEQNKD